MNRVTDQICRVTETQRYCISSIYCSQRCRAVFGEALVHDFFLSGRVDSQSIPFECSQIEFSLRPTVPCHCVATGVHQLRQKLVSIGRGVFCWAN